MKKISKITMLLLACLLIVGITDVEAQYGKKKKKKKKTEKTEKVDDDDYFDESGGKFIDKLWYGGGVNIGYAGNNAESVFNVGISPMVGYKITDRLSFGPRVVIDYTTRRLDLGQIVRLNTTNLGGGLFGRFKAFGDIFLHVEYEIMNESLPELDASGRPSLKPGTNKLETFRQTTNNFYIGGGYSSAGGGIGYEIVVLYNTLAPDDVVDLPIDFRLGFTWNF